MVENYHQILDILHFQHYVASEMEFLDDQFPGRWIGRSGLTEW